MRASARYAMLLAAATAVAAGARGRAAEQQDFSRYQIIIDRTPFGTTGGNPAPDAQPSFSTKFAFVGLVKTESNQALLAIIQDKEKNRPYFVGEGETIPNDNVKLVRIERSPSKIVLQQGLETATLVYQAHGTAAPVTPVNTGAPQPGQPSAPVPGRRRIPFMRQGG